MARKAVNRSVNIMLGSLGTAARHAQCLWLFSFSDLKTIILPESAFGVLNSYSAPVFGISTTNVPVGYRIITALFWTWINLLPFLISNQIQPLSVLEDRMNKPWRPMPSNLMTQREAKAWMLFLYASAVMVSGYLGGLKQCLALIALGFWYNNLNGAEQWLPRNAINGAGFVCYASGAMEVSRAAPLPAAPPMLVWLAIIAIVVFSTVQLQDMYDQVGDGSRGRKTLPLSVGDVVSRWITVASMLTWSVLCPAYWSLQPAFWFAFTGLGALVAIRAVLKRSVEDDKATFRLWNVWMVLLYSMPLVKHMGF